MSLLGSAVFDESVANEILHLLTLNDFYIPAHKEIFSIIQTLRSDGLPIDEGFIIPELKKKNKNAEEIMIEVMSANPVSLSGIKKYVSIIKELSHKRRLLDLSFNIRKKLSDSTDAISLLSEISDSLDALQAGMVSEDDSRNISDIYDEIESDMEKARSGEKVPFFTTGYVNFDSYVGGFVESGLTVIAARPSMGKSSFMSGPIVSAINRKEGAVLYSMEVADKNALLRLTSFKSGEPLSNLKIGMLNNFNSYKEAKEFFVGANSSFSIVDRTGMSRKDLEIDIIRRKKADPNLKIVLVDHLLQMYIDENGHAPTELGNITKMLKRLAQKYRLTIVLLSQLNRSVEKRDNRRPMMSDLQGSGSIEQDADMIIFLYRPEYYKEKEWNSEEKGEYVRPEIEHAEAIVGKNRDGPTGSVELGFKSKTASFVNDNQTIDEFEYVDDEIDINMGHKASNKDSSDSIYNENNTENVTMPLI